MLKNLPTALKHMRKQIMAELGDDAPSERADDPLSRAEAWRLLHEAHESNRKREGLQLRRGGARPVHHALSPGSRVRTMEALARDLASAADDHTADLVRAIDTACNRALVQTHLEVSRRPWTSLSRMLVPPSPLGRRRGSAHA